MKRILFVDDEPRVLEGLQNLLRRHRRKWDMTFAPGGPAALELLKTQRFDVIVSDMLMPEVNGAALLTWVQREYPHTVRIVLSGHMEVQMVMQALPVVHQFLSKPCDAEQLENVIERTCQIQTLIDDPKIQQAVGGIQQLPALPQVYQQLTQALAEDRTQARDVATLLQQDMTLCAKLLQIVNSAFFRLARRITNVEEAVCYLGFTMVRNLALTIGVFNASEQPAGFSFEALQQQALRVASLSRQIIADSRRADDAYMAGMLHNIGKLVLALRMPEPSRQARALARQRQRPLWQMEQELLGVSHAEVGAYLLGLWGLPYPIIEAAAYHHQPRTAPPYEFDVLAAVHIANGLIGEMAETDGLPPGPLDSDYLAALGVLGKLEGWRALANTQSAALDQE
ncbi:response regulator [Candidatus Contendibacter odensensis]|uniref:Response regulator receiver modulated metal dependent phosphohydrolase n=1 Tax=Candidatus Contendobacter odensis Run_B_J11 TaxID=1400861 RepID=A0A7U7G9P8_9GAMM|nr:response regulator [Candidatus Contendobacter odensis]CDH44135.1 putative Response regulator receiver modulated metal dependent phosphohydrolase [Candidatus Contendobacter odensis Run_B_J11]